MNIGKERFILLSVIVVAGCALVIYLFTQSRMDSTSSPISEDYAVSDVTPSTDIETLPPILRNRAARKRAEESASTGSEAIQSPIELEMSLLSFNEIGEGGEAIVEVRVKPMIDAPAVKWNVEIPDGLTLKSGRASWEGRIARDELKSFQLAISIPDGKMYELLCGAEILLDSEGSLTRGTSLRIALGREDGETSSFKRVGADGRSVTTYKGESQVDGE